MKYRRLGRTGLMVSEIGFGAEWMERHSAEECKAVLERAEALGINILDRRKKPVLLFLCFSAFTYGVPFSPSSFADRA